jgi:hypothetical protein
VLLFFLRRTFAADATATDGDTIKLDGTSYKLDGIDGPPERVQSMLAS